MNRDLPDVQAGFRKGRGIRDQIANIHWIMEKAREFEKYIYFCFFDYAKAFDCVDHNQLWKILKEMGPDAMIFIFLILSFKSIFSLSSFTLKEAFEFLFTFCHKGGGICISEVIDISPSNFDSSLCFFQSSVSHDVLCIEVK